MIKCKINVIFSTFHLSCNVIELISLQFKKISTECPGHAECGKINQEKLVQNTSDHIQRSMACTSTINIMDITNGKQAQRNTINNNY